MGNERYTLYAQHGICVDCGREKAAPNRKRCWECLCKNNESKATKRQTMTEEQKRLQKEQDCKRHKERYARLKAAGICPRCGKRPAASGKTLCPFCAAINRRAAEKVRRAKGQLPEDMLGDGYHCATCGADVYKRKLCDRCHANAMRAIAIAQANACGGWRDQPLVFGKADRSGT